MPDCETKANNIAALQKHLSSLISKLHITENERKRFSDRLTDLQVKIPIQSIKSVKSADQEIDIVEERKKHEELTQDLVELTSILKNHVSNISEVTDIDSKVVSDVKAKMTSTNDAVKNTVDNLTEKFSKRLGFRAYYYFGCVLVVFLLVNFFLL
jgi:vacuolar-type H+-ATPase subunit I/STV1